MLRSLVIRNYALISALEIHFSKGFSVLTGETGAGKSIILGALSLILGQRADAKSIKQGESKCWIEGIFDISEYNLQALFEERDWEYDAQQCVLRRELWNTGKSRAFINDTPVGINDLKELSSYLIDVHSQHQNLLLGEGNFQREVLDLLAANRELMGKYQEAFKQNSALQRQFDDLKNEAAANTAEEDFLRFQFQQLSEAKLQADEQLVLEAELKTLSNMQEIKSGLYKAGQLLLDDEGVISSMKEILNTSQALGKIYDESEIFHERFQSIYLDLKDLALELSSRQERLEFNPERLEWINERLDLLYGLQQKHRVGSIQELIEICDQMEGKLQAIQNYDEQLVSLQSQLDASQKRVLSLAAELSGTRKKAVPSLEKQLVEKVIGLGLPHIRFVCEINPKSRPDMNGADEVSFLFSANKNIELRPVSAIASGGEISRLMLGIKALIAGAKALPTIIFDEIDTGISGEVADKMASIMQELGKMMQVVTITHLPQIASKGDHHFFVFKDENKHSTETNIRQLSLEERIQEIAQMLSGSAVTEAAVENAKILIGQR